MIAAIGSDGMRPIVWGLGETEDAARADAERWCLAPNRWDRGGSAYVPVAPEIVARIEAGNVDCQDLGIRVRCDRDGDITDAEVR